MLSDKKIEDYSMRSLLIADDYKTRVTEYRLDAERKRRLLLNTCKTCWYILHPKKGGRVFTRAFCEGCGTLLTSKTTVINKLCDACAEHNTLCKECGAHLHYVPKID